MSIEVEKGGSEYLPGAILLVDASCAVKRPNAEGEVVGECYFVFHFVRSRPILGSYRWQRRRHSTGSLVTL
jgi:hypothetical protein